MSNLHRNERGDELTHCGLWTQDEDENEDGNECDFERREQSQWER